MMTTTHRQPVPATHSSSVPPSQGAVIRTIWARAVAEKSTIIGILTFYGLALGAAMGALWIPLQDTFANIEMPAGFDAILGGLSLNTPEGWINAEMLSMVGPGFLIAAALISAGSSTAGEEQRATLGLTLSTGTTRTAFLAAKSAAVVTNIVIVSAGMFVGLLIGNVIADLGLSVGALVDATIWMVLFALMYGAISLTIGVSTGNSKLAVAIPGAVAGLSFVLTNFLAVNESLTEVAKVNLWYPYSGHVALVDGIDWGMGTLMLGITVAVSILGFVVFNRRTDLRG